MKVILHSSLKTGVRVYKVTSGPLPNIGDVIVGKDFKAKVLDIIGPIHEPFLVVRPLAKNLATEAEVKVAKGKRGRR